MSELSNSLLLNVAQGNTELQTKFLAPMINDYIKHVNRMVLTNNANLIDKTQKSAYTLAYTALAKRIYEPGHDLVVQISSFDGKVDMLEINIIFKNLALKNLPAVRNLHYVKKTKQNSFFMLDKLVTLKPLTCQIKLRTNAENNWQQYFAQTDYCIDKNSFHRYLSIKKA